MKLTEITKFSNRIQQVKPKWEYNQDQIELIEGINKNVDGFYLANIILKKYMEHKTKPTVDQIEKVILTMDNKEDSNKSGCDKCKNGFISVYNTRMWYYDTEIQGYISHHGWNPDKIESIFEIPKMDISCSCSIKNKKMKKISSYLLWLEKFDFIASEFFEICYIQLYLFYSQSLENSLKFDAFDPWLFWGVKPNSKIDFTINNIINQRLKDMLLDIESGGMGINVKECLKHARNSLRQIQSSPFPKKDVIDEEDDIDEEDMI